MNFGIAFVLLLPLFIATDCALFVPSPDGLSYHALSGSHSFGDGWQKCDQLNASLILPSSAEIQNHLLHLFPQVFENSRVWVDAVGIPLRKVYLPTGHDYSADSYQPWASGFPKRCKTSCCAATLQASGHWEVWNCSQLYRVICQRESRSDSVSYVKSTYGKEYYHNLTAVSREEAVLSCEALDATLVSIETPKEQIFISNFVSSDYFWTSAKYSRVDGWTWMSGNAFLYTNPFSRGNGHCTSIGNCCIYVLNEKYGWKWYQHDCSTKMGFICERQTTTSFEYGAFIREAIVDLDQRIREHEKSHAPALVFNSHDNFDNIIANLEQRIEKLENESVSTAGKVFELGFNIRGVQNELNRKIAQADTNLKMAMKDIESQMEQPDERVIVTEKVYWPSYGSVLVFLVVLSLIVAAGWLCWRRGLCSRSLREPSTTLNANINKPSPLRMSDLKMRSVDVD